MILTPLSVRRDAEFKDTAILFNCDGPNGTGNLRDSSRFRLAWNTTGVTHSTAQAVFGDTSAQSTSTADRVSRASSSLVTRSGAAPWTLQMRFRTTSLASAIVVFDTSTSATNTTGWQMYVGTDGRFAVFSGPQGLNYGLFTGSVVVNTWAELCVTWDGSVLRFFKDGALLGTSPAGFTSVWGGNLTLFNSAFNTQGGSGTKNYDAFRFVHACLYTASYTPATRRFSGYGGSVPTLTTGLDPNLQDSFYAYSSGNTVVTRINANSTHYTTRSLRSNSAGKFFYTVTLTSQTAADGLVAGFVTPADALTNYPGVRSSGWACQFNRVAGPVRINNNVFTAIAGSTVCAVGDVGMVAVDLTAGHIWYGRNGVWWNSGNPAAGTNPTQTLTGGTTLYVAVSEFAAAVRTFHLSSAGAPYAAPSGFTFWDE